MTVVFGLSPCHSTKTPTLVVILCCVLANGLTGCALKNALHGIIDNQFVQLAQGGTTLLPDICL